MTKARRLDSAVAHPRRPATPWETIMESVANAIRREPWSKGKIVG